jgi:hypothetical protein
MKNFRLVKEVTVGEIGSNMYNKVKDFDVDPIISKAKALKNTIAEKNPNFAAMMGINNPNAPVLPPNSPPLPLTTSEHIHAALKGIKDSVKSTVEENPKTATALAAAAAIGGGYKTYKYLKNRRDNKKNKK